ncbi:hypothetical protein Tco_0805747 [Tanacetum coccineum]
MMDYLTQSYRVSLNPVEGIWKLEGYVSGSEYPATVAACHMHEAGTHVHTPAHGGTEAHDGLSDSILLSKAKPGGRDMEA